MTCTAGAVCGLLTWPRPMLSRRRVFTMATLPTRPPTGLLGTLAGIGTHTLTCGPGCHGTDFSTARSDIRSSHRVMECTRADSATDADMRAFQRGLASVLPRGAGSPVVVSTVVVSAVAASTVVAAVDAAKVKGTRRGFSRVCSA